MAVQPNANEHGLESLKKATVEIDPGNPNELMLRVHIVSSDVPFSPGGSLVKKAKKVLAGDFVLISGSYVYDVAFDTAFADDTYVVPMPCGADSRSFTIENQAPEGFRINTNSSLALTGPVSWIAVEEGET